MATIIILDKAVEQFNKSILRWSLFEYSLHETKINSNDDDEEEIDTKFKDNTNKNDTNKEITNEKNINDEEEKPIFIPNFVSPVTVFLKILITLILIFLIIYSKEIQQLLNEKSTAVLGLAIMAVVLLLCIMKEVWLNGYSWYLIFVGMATICICSFGILYMPREFALLTGLAFGLSLIALTWPIFMTKISFISTALGACTDELSLIMWILSGMHVPNSSICLLVYIGVSIFFSVLWLNWHLKLIRRFGEDHFLSDFSIYSNIANLFIKIQLGMYFYNSIK